MCLHAMCRCALTLLSFTRAETCDRASRTNRVLSLHFEMRQVLLHVLRYIKKTTAEPVDSNRHVRLVFPQVYFRER